MELIDPSSTPSRSGSEPKWKRPPLEEMEINTGLRRQWFSWLGYLLIFFAVCGLFGFMFFEFTGSFRLAVVLVGFLAIYMTIMGWLASRNAEQR